MKQEVKLEDAELGLGGRAEKGRAVAVCQKVY